MVKAKIGYDSENDHLFIVDSKKHMTIEGIQISDNFLLLVDSNNKIKDAEISFAYEFFKEFDPVNFKKNILKDVKKAEFNVKEHRDLVLTEIVFVYKGKKIREKLVFLKENFS